MSRCEKTDCIKLIVKTVGRRPNAELESPFLKFVSDLYVPVGGFAASRDPVGEFGE